MKHAVDVQEKQEMKTKPSKQPHKTLKTRTQCFVTEIIESYLKYHYYILLHHFELSLGHLYIVQVVKKYPSAKSAFVVDDRNQNTQYEIGCASRHEKLIEFQM